jgi:hypothetical protein
MYSVPSIVGPSPSAILAGILGHIFIESDATTAPRSRQRLRRRNPNRTACKAESTEAYAIFAGRQTMVR